VLEQVYGVLLDTMGIQRYVFSSNNLKENIGASQLVDDIYDSHLREVIKKIFHITDEHFYTTWQDSPHLLNIRQNSAPFEIGYIGGGNALLLFREENKAKEFIKEWSMRLLVHCPGIIPACAIQQVDFGHFSDSLSELFKKLALRKGSFVPETIIRRHGITAECSRTGFSAEVFCEKLPAEGQDYISSVSHAKIMAAEEADRRLKDILKESGLDKEYTFTDLLDKLGQSHGEDSHIAIVHIDGNDTAQRFMNQRSLEDIRRLSKTFKAATFEAFKKMLEEVVKNIENFDKIGLKLGQSHNKTILPLRPIIIGGDDITFVSEGRLGIWLAKIFLEHFSKQTVSDSEPISACAGIAITRTKYPFYRGYRLSEELTRIAKNSRKKENDNGSWIDFHFAYGGFSGTLGDIRREQYQSCDGTRLILRPYKIDDFNELLIGVAELKGKGGSKFPRSKLMDLRQVLYLSEAEQELFLRELMARRLKLPSYTRKGFSGDELVLNRETPYLDMIEIMDFYPEFALPGRKI